jgi:hypothetical protein
MPPRSRLSSLYTLPFITVMAASSAGCGLIDIFEAKTTLADLAPQNAQIVVELNDEPKVELVLEADQGACEAITDDVEAHVDDRPMDLFMRGGEQPAKGGWVCGAPTFRRALSTEELGGASTRFGVADETAKITVEVEGLLVPRTITPDAEGGRILPGEELGLAWSAPGDELDPETLVLTFTYDDPLLTLAVPLSARVEGSDIIVKLPPGSPEGKGTLHVDVKAHIAAVECTGAPKCEAIVRVETNTTLEVEPIDPP